MEKCDSNQCLSSTAACHIYDGLLFLLIISLKPSKRSRTGICLPPAAYYLKGVLQIFKVQSELHLAHPLWILTLNLGTTGVLQNRNAAHTRYCILYSIQVLSLYSAATLIIRVRSRIATWRHKQDGNIYNDPLLAFLILRGGNSKANKNKPLPLWSNCRQ